LDGNVLSAELAQLMQVPGNAGAGIGRARGHSLLRRAAVAAGEVSDPQMLLSVLTGIGLSELMSLSVYSGTSLLQELDAAQAAGGATDPTNPFAAEFLHNMLSLPLPDLMSVARCRTCFSRTTPIIPGISTFVWNLEPPEAAGALPGDAHPPSDHHPEQPAVGIDTLPVPRRRHPPQCSRLKRRRRLRHHDRGHFAAGNLHDALGGDDYVVLPSTPAVAPRSATIPHKRSAAARQ